MLFIILCLYRDGLGVVFPCLLQKILHGLCLSDERKNQRIAMAFLSLCNLNYPL